MTLRTIRRTAVVLAAALAGVFALFLLAAHTRWARGYVAKRVREQARSAGVAVEIGRLDYNLLAGSVQALQVAASRVEPAGLPPFLKAGRVQVNVSMLALVRGDIVIEDAALEGLSIHLFTDEQGRSNLPDSTPSAEPRSPELPEFLIAQLAGGGSLLFEDRRAGIRAGVPAWTANVTGERAGLDHRVGFRTARPSTLTYQGLTMTVDEVTLEGAFNRRRASVEALRVVSGTTQVTVKGSAEGFADPVLDAHVDAALDLPSLLRAAGVAYPVSGRVRAEIRVGNRASAPVVTGEFASEGLAVEPVGNLDVLARARWSGEDGRAELESATVRSAEGQLNVHGAWTGTDNTATVEIERLDLSRLSRKLRLPARVASVATGTIHAQWSGTAFERATVRAALRVASTQEAAEEGVAPVSATIAAQVHAGRVTVEARDVRALGAEMRAEASLGLAAGRALAGQAHGRIEDLASLAAGVNGFLGRPGAIAANGQAGFDIQLSGSVARPTAVMRLDGVDLGYGPIRGAGLHLEASYEAAQISLQTARLAWAGTVVTAEGSLGLEGQKRPFQFHAAARDVTADQVMGALGQTVPVKGTLSLEAHGDGSLDNPSVMLALDGVEVEAFGEPLGRLTASAAFADKTLRLEELRIERPDGTGVLTAGGALATETRNYTGRLEAKGFELSKLPVRGLVNLSARGDGTLENPSAEIEVHAAGIEAEGRKLGALKVTGKLADRQAHLTATSEWFGLRAGVEARTEAPYPMSVQFEADATDLSRIDASLKGSVSARVEASGEAGNWREGNARIEVGALRVETPAGEVTNDGALRATYDRGTIEIQAARLAAPKSTLAVEGTFPGTLRYEGQLDLAAMLGGRQEELSASGMARLEGEVRGDFEKIEPAGTLVIRDGRLEAAPLKSPLDKVQVDVALERGQLDVRRLEAAVGPGRIVAKGTVPLGLFPLPSALDVARNTGPARFDLEARELRIETLVDLPETVKGEVSLQLEASASKPELEAVDATVTLDRLNLELAGVQVTPEAPPVLSLRNGVASVNQFTLRAPASVIHLSGAAALADQQLKNVQLNGGIDASLLSSFSDSVSAAGAMKFQFAANGDWANPSIDGYLEMFDGQVGLTSPAVQASSLDVRIGLKQHRVEIERFQGELNGGTIEAAGGMQVEARGPRDVRLDVKAGDVYVEFPSGLRSLSSANLRLRPAGEFLEFGGSVRIKEGSYTDPLDAASLLSYAQSSGGVELAEERNPLLSRLRFNIAVGTDEPLIVDNNLGELAVTADLRMLGNPYRPAMTGRVTIEEGGRLRLQENEYIIEQGSISFVNEARIEPALDLTARTRVRDRNITLRVFSGRDGLETDLASDEPSDTQADIVALLLTGRTAEGLEGRELNVAGEQVALSLLAGSVTGRLSQGLQNTLGVSQVRLEPSLISPESDPTARLTIGQDITSALELIYSMNLTDSNDQIVVVDYDLTRRFSTRGTKQSDNTYRFDFQHDLRFGAKRPQAAAAARVARRVGQVRFTGNPAFREEALASKFKVEAGDRYDFFQARRGVDLLESFYRDEDHLEAKIRLRRETRDDEVGLEVNIEAGPRVAFAFEGWEASGGLRKRVRELWRRGVFDSQRAESSRTEIRRELAEEGYLEAEVEHEIREPSSESKLVVFTVVRGTRYKGTEIVFDGARGIAPKRLRQQLERAELADKLATRGNEARDFLARYYRQEGFLDAEVSGPRYEYDRESGRASIRFTITEGVRYKFGSLRFDGASAFTGAELENLSGIRTGMEYAPELAQQSRDRVEEAYWTKGYRDVVIDYGLARRPGEDMVDVTVKIQENQPSVVREVVVEGTDRTSEEFVRKQLELGAGDALDHTRTARSRRNLYNTGAYSAVELLPRAIEGAAPGSAVGISLLARVQERTPFQFRYGGFYDTDRGPGFIADFSNRNSLGGGRVVGVRTRYDGDVRELRGYFSQPLLRSLPLRSDVASFLRRELREAFITDRVGVSVQQEAELRNRFLLTYGYRFERAHTFDRDPDAFIPFDEVLRVAPLTATLSRDTRDELLDATRGSFTSHAFEFASGKLGSSLLFARYFGQYFRYIGLTDPAPVPFGRGLERPRVVYAGGVRVGLAKGLGGQEVIRSERFFAGGGTTIRGFDQDGVGPRDFLDRPAGGDAVLVINNEIRFPVIIYFDAVGFLDIGNVYPKLADFSLSDVRKTAGVGLRLRTPWILLRLDYGFKLDRKPAESRGKWFLSIGQAF